MSAKSQFQHFQQKSGQILGVDIWTYTLYLAKILIMRGAQFTWASLETVVTAAMGDRCTLNQVGAVNGSMIEPK
jgi:hypothetical protein